VFCKLLYKYLLAGNHHRPDGYD